MAFFRRPAVNIDVGQAFRDNRQLEQFVLIGVTPTGRKLGTGSFGSVEEVNYQQIICAGKRIHEALLDVENEGVPEMIHKYQQECQLMSSLRHPNITQFLGICFLPGTQLPLLVMELLETSLDDLLEHMPNLPLSLKRSVLENVASGLLYLHNRNPPVIHRDLTSKNVLLTSSLVAKITDMGNSRIADMRSGQMVRTLSALPGTLVYMPPEALDNRHRYGASLDIFSFGHLALFTITQRFPGDLLPITFYEAGNLQARNEVQRREQYIEILEALVGRYHPALVELVKECLHNDPDQRPTTGDMLARLRRVREEVEGQYGYPFKLDMARVRLAKEVQIKDRRIEELTQQQQRHEAESAEKTIELEAKTRELEEKTRQLEELHLRETRLREELQSQEAEISRLREELSKCQGMPQEGAKKLPLQLKWRRGPDMPFKMSDYAQSVQIQGTLYVGGGDAGIFNENNYVVTTYDIRAGKWATLPPHRAHSFAMTVISNHLVLVGGMGRGGYSKVLGVWRADSKKWTHLYPDMTTPRGSCSTVTYKQWVVVAGGYGAGGRLSSVEVMNTDTKQWYAGPPTPIAWSSMKTAVVDDMCYLMGGCIGDGGANNVKVYSVSFSAFVSQLNPDSSAKDTQIWKEIPQLPVKYAAPLSISGSLLAVGGTDKYDKAVSAIHLYQPDAGQWVKVSDMPAERYDCTCTMTTDQELLVAGGYAMDRLARVDIAHNITC